jgi:hypothetical protein
LSSAWWSGLHVECGSAEVVRLGASVASDAWSSG